MTQWSRRDVVRRNAVTLTGADPSTSAPILLLAHGFGTDQTMWGRMLPHLGDGFRIALMDHVGAGRSDLSAYQPHRYLSLEGYAADVVDVVRELHETLGGPVHLVGHSAGGVIGALASLERPEDFASLTLVGASPRYVDAPGYTGGFTREGVEELLASMQANYLGFTRQLAPMAMANPDRPELAEELAESFARTQASIALDFARAIFLSDFRAEVSRVSVPALVIQSAVDPLVPPETGQFLHTAITGSRLARLEATGHFPHISGPDETATILVDFLAGHLVR